MQVIRQYAVPENGILTIEVPEAFDGKQVEVQVVLAQEVSVKAHKSAGRRGLKTTGLETLVGKYKHYTAEQNQSVDQVFSAMRDEWERTIF